MIYHIGSEGWTGFYYQRPDRYSGLQSSTEGTYPNIITRIVQYFPSVEDLQFSFAAARLCTRLEYAEKKRESK